MTDTNHIEVLRKVIHWAESRCPCKEETPDPCTLCGATVAEGTCKAVESVFPRDLLRDLRDALSARASAGEGGPSCPAIDADKPTDPDSKRLAALADWMDILAPGRSLSARTYLLELSRRLAAPQPGRAGASGGDWICGFCKRTYTLDAICCDKQRVHRRTTPQPVAAQGQWLVELVAKAIYSQWTFMPGYVEWVERGNSIRQDDARELARAHIAAAPQPQEAPVPVRIDCPQCTAPHVDEGEWATRPHKTHQCQACGHEWRPFPYATVGTPPAQATVKESLTVPPAHGDGEGKPVFHLRSYGDVSASDLAAITTRPTPEAQEARDAARYRWLRDPENAIVYAKDLANWNGVPYSKPYGHFSYATPEQLDTAIDAALALPAQAEGES